MPPESGSHLFHPAQVKLGGVGLLTTDVRCPKENTCALTFAGHRRGCGGMALDGLTVGPSVNASRSVMPFRNHVVCSPTMDRIGSRDNHYRFISVFGHCHHAFLLPCHKVSLLEAVGTPNEVPQTPRANVRTESPGRDFNIMNTPRFVGPEKGLARNNDHSSAARSWMIYVLGLIS
jgi:hypothetical protein